jgi:hypothetical protein
MARAEQMFRIVGDHLVSYGQAHQDLFALFMLDFKRNGTYLEIGGADPIEANNTYLLEHYFGWSGLSIDIDPQLVARFNAERQNRCLLGDATNFEFGPHLHEYARDGRIDYLSLDVDPADVTYRALRNLPMNTLRFSVITYEHDAYLSGPSYMLRSRDYLAGLGYQRVVSNVSVRQRDFEDWWIDPAAICKSRWKPFEASAIECAEAFQGRRTPADLPFGCRMERGIPARETDEKRHSS